MGEYTWLDWWFDVVSNFFMGLLFLLSNLLMVGMIGTMLYMLYRLIALIVETGAQP